jgi:hypothetical protein
MIKLVANFGGDVNKTVVSNIGGKVEEINILENSCNAIR